MQDISYPAEALAFNKPTEGKVVTQKEFDKLEEENIKSLGDISSGGVKVIRLGK